MIGEWFVRGSSRQASGSARCFRSVLLAVARFFRALFPAFFRRAITVALVSRVLRHVPRIAARGRRTDWARRHPFTYTHGRVSCSRGEFAALPLASACFAARAAFTAPPSVAYKANGPPR